MDNRILRNLSVTTEEKDLEVYITNNLKPSTQYLKAANKAMELAGLRMVKSNFRRLDVEGFTIVYKGYIGLIWNSAFKSGHRFSKKINKS